MAKEIPVYLFTGFLDGGKTRFIQETLGDPRFNKGERTLLLMCEDGEEEYDPSAFAGKNVFIEAIETPEDVNPTLWESLRKEKKAERVLIEYNGLWLLDELYKALPEGWTVYQEFFFADARSFVSYNTNMRQFVYDKLKSCELAVFNRCDDTVDKLSIHKIVRGISRRCDIAYERPDGEVEYDEIEDPLPFDLNAPIVEIEDRDYAIWYRDMSEDMEKYQGKTLRFKGRVAKSTKLQNDCFVIGRQLMTCCVDDIQFTGLICRWPEAAALEKGSWVTATVTIDIKYHKGYGRKGPVLMASAVESCPPPAEPVATFY